MGFEPMKLNACDLKSHSFDQTWISIRVNNQVDY